ncbi:MAG: IS5 family transposase [Methanoregula sp.]|nr:IS5 family transposase [Methanoregula sp.]
MKPRKKMQEVLFPFIEMGKLVPEDHMLRMIDRYVDFSFIDGLVDHTYSETTGRPAEDPELMVRILTVGYLYNLSEKKLFEELKMHAAYRWFCNLGFHEKVPDRSTLNKLRNHRWASDGIFEQIMQNIVKQCITAGLVSGKHLAVDGTKIRANASIKSLEPIVVDTELDEYLGRLGLKRRPKSEKEGDTHPDDRDFRDKKLSNETHRSSTDPDARLYKKSLGQEASLSYVGNNLIDTKSRVILAAKVTQPGISTESDAAREMLDMLEQTGLSKNIQTLAADKGYGSTEFVTDLIDRGITPHIPLLAKSDLESMPVWKTKTSIFERQIKRDAKVKQVLVRNYVRLLAKTQGYKLSQKLRKRIEHIFAEAKICHGLARARCRGLVAMQQQLSLTAFVQNIKRLVRFMKKNSANTMIPIREIGYSALFLTILSSFFRTSTFS